MMYATHTFSGTKTLVFGDLEVELVEAPGETHDHLVVWSPEERTLIAGDNFYWAFPNLYVFLDRELPPAIRNGPGGGSPGRTPGSHFGAWRR